MAEYSKDHLARRKVASLQVGFPKLIQRPSSNKRTKAYQTHASDVVTPEWQLK